MGGGLEGGGDEPDELEFAGAVAVGRILHCLLRICAGPDADAAPLRMVAEAKLPASRKKDMLNEVALRNTGVSNHGDMEGRDHDHDMCVFVRVRDDSIGTRVVSE